MTEKIARIHDEVGGFGHLLVFGFDYVEHPQAWRRSLELLAKEVLPRVKHLSPRAEQQPTGGPMLQGEAISLTKADASSHN